MLERSRDFVRRRSLNYHTSALAFSCAGAVKYTPIPSRRTVADEEFGVQDSSIRRTAQRARAAALSAGMPASRWSAPRAEA